MSTNNPVITVQEARKLLGKDSKALSDEAVEKLINDLDFIARYTIKNFKEFNKDS
jgi:hypothetical protein